MLSVGLLHHHEQAFSRCYKPDNLLRQRWRTAFLLLCYIASTQREKTSAGRLVYAAVS